MSDWRISPDEYKTLLKFIGYGDFPNADIIAFGNEGGTGGYSVEANVKAQANIFGKDEASGDYIYTVKEDSQVLGFHEPSGQSGHKKVEQYLRPDEQIKEEFAGGVFNNSLARICLAIEDKQDRDWFELKSENKETGKIIDEYVVNELYKSREGKKTALADWAPLPRKKMNDWPEAFLPIARSIKRNPYVDVFYSPKAKLNKNKYDQPLFSNFYEDMQNRLHILKVLFESSKAKVIIGIGGANDYKKYALELMFGDKIFSEIKFEEADMIGPKGNENKSYTAVVPMKDRSLHIFLIPFPSGGRVFKTGKDALNMLRELTYKHINPIFPDRE